MRTLAALLCVSLVSAAPATAEDGRLDWPLQPRPAVVRQFDAPAPNWNRGHRGVDLAGAPGQAVYAAAAGTVVFAGQLADRPVVSIAHPGGLRTSYEPVRAGGAGGTARQRGHGARRVDGRPPRLRRRACTGARCGVPPRVPTTSIPLAWW